MTETTDQNAEAAPEMSFLGHLEELRSRLFKAVAGILVACIGTGYFNNEIMQEVLLRPARESHAKLQNLEPFGQAFLQFKVIFVSGLIAAFPWVLYQIWRFVAPGLYHHERAWARKITFYSSLCFLAGVSFGYFLLIPAMMNYTTEVAVAGIEDNFSATSYFSFMTNMVLASGLIFELPMISWVLARFGIITAAAMSKYRRHAIVAILIIAAVITPSPDPGTQLMVATPLYILYEISVLLVKATEPRRTPAREKRS